MSNVDAGYTALLAATSVMFCWVAACFLWAMHSKRKEHETFFGMCVLLTLIPFTLWCFFDWLLTFLSGINHA